MQVHFTSDQEARLAQLAVDSDTDAEHLVREAALRLLEEDLRFRAGVQRGIADVQHGRVLESSEVWNSVEEILEA